MENKIMTYVVHLEDDGPLREILKVAFQATDPNLNLKQFVNSDEVVAHIKPNIQLIDLFVLDIRVPGSIDGLAVAHKIRELGSDAPIILTSAYRPPGREVVELLNLEWMSKPWHIMEIAQRLVKLARDQRAKAAKTLAKPEVTTPPALTTPASTAPAVNPAVVNSSLSNSAAKISSPTVTPPAANPPAPTAPAANTPASNPSTFNPPTVKPPVPTAPVANSPVSNTSTVNPPAPKPPTTSKT
jgi:FixJ family two-component response regulator